MSPRSSFHCQGPLTSPMRLGVVQIEISHEYASHCSDMSGLTAPLEVGLGSGVTVSVKGWVIAVKWIFQNCIDNFPVKEITCSEGNPVPV